MPRGERSEFFPFYPADFASDGLVEAMTTQEVGAYILLLCKAWWENPPASIPDNDSVLARWTRLTPDEWAGCKARVLAPWTTRADKRLYQRRLESEHSKLRQLQGRRRESGRRGAEARWQTDGEAIGNAMAPPKQTHGTAITPPARTSSLSSSSKGPVVVKVRSISWSSETGFIGINEHHRQQWKIAYPACDLRRQEAAMSEWLKANPTKAKKSNWLRFITNWLARQQDRGGDTPSNGAGHSNGVARGEVGRFPWKDGLMHVNPEPVRPSNAEVEAGMRSPG